MSELWITGGTIVTMDGSRRIIPKGNIQIRDGRIVAVGDAERLPAPGGAAGRVEGDVVAAFDGVEILDATGTVVLPGLINAHAHADCILMRGGISQDRVLYDWLVNVLDPARLQLTEDEVRLSIRLYCREALHSGMTTIVDLAGYSRDANHAAALATYAEMGVRVRYAPMFLDQPPLGNRLVLDASSEKSRAMLPVESTAQALGRIESYLRQYHNTADGRVKVWIAPRLGRATTPDGLRQSVKMAGDYDTMTTTHCAETKTESIGSAVTSVEYLDECGYLSPRSVLAHCVWVNATDIERLAASRTSVAHAPSTNLYLGSGIAPVTKMLDAGVKVGLATDNANANDLVNLFAEMRLAALLQKGVNGDAAALTAEEALEMATIAGARAIGEEKELGSLEAGKRADLILVELQAASLAPVHHLPAALVYQASGAEVSAVVVGGRVLMLGRRFTGDAADEAALHEQAREASLSLAQRAGIDLGRLSEWRSRIFAGGVQNA